MSNYTHFFFVSNRLDLIKVCFCCFVDMHLYSKILSTTGTNSSLLIFALLPAFFSSSDNSNLSHSSLESDEKNIVLWDGETPEVETSIPVDFSNFFKSSISSVFINCSLYIKVHFFCKFIL